jgi:hypothetical protein
MKLVSVNSAYLLGGILMAKSAVALTKRQLAATAPNLNYCPGSVKQNNRTHKGAFFALWNQTDASWNVPAVSSLTYTNSSFQTLILQPYLYEISLQRSLRTISLTAWTSVTTAAVSISGFRHVLARRPRFTYC